MKKKSVGRPKKTDRDAAVSLARWWRTECCKDSVSQAHEWIVEHWGSNTPAGKSPGISDVAHVRAAVRRAKETWLGTAELLVSDGWQLSEKGMRPIDPERTQFVRLDEVDGAFSLDGCVVVAVEMTLHHRSKCLFWSPGLLAAKRGRLVPEGLHVPVGDGPSPAQRQGRTAIAAAIAASIGLSRLGQIQRLHAGSPAVFGFKS